MHVLWPKFVFTPEYREGTRPERRFIELKLALGKEVRRLRHHLGLTQKQLAHLMGADHSTISRMERAAPRRITIDLYLWALFVMGATDFEVGCVFNAATSPVVQRMRGRATLPYFPRPADIRRDARNHHHRRRAAARPDDRYECCIHKRKPRRGGTARDAPHDGR